MRGRTLFGGVRRRDDEHEHAVGQRPEAFREHDEHQEDDADDRHVDTDEGGDTGADAGDHGAFLDEIQTAWRAAGASPIAVRSAVARRLVVRPLHGAHLGDDLIHLSGRHDVLLRVQEPEALFGDRLLEVGEDFGPVWIAGELLLGLLEVGDEGRVAALFDLIGVSVQVDRDDFLHG